MDMHISRKINILRAIVMGANDGIISIAGVVFGVFGASMSTWAILIAGLTATIAGTFSMATGEYVSVNAQLDSERAAKVHQQRVLAEDFAGEKAFLTANYIDEGITPVRAQALATEVMAHDALKETLALRYGIDADNLISPMQAAVASMIAFPLGAILPMVGMTVISAHYRVVATIIFVVIALILTGYFSAKFGDAPAKQSVLRNVIAGLFTMAVTYGVGLLVGM
ncbi:VIT family protein [Periweissella cryptocerci]|uniref:VIT family protein n=1 Tax=Periweissella cryptocerci TaxID=2506420 RepID=A0A4V1AIL5_9LACO|nr:VIT family protein [Periweissella cryptocerci]QBO35925.1 VIT family protein [Periweissella cryptocerci]